MSDPRDEMRPGLRAREFRPCDHCGGKLGISFYTLTISQHVLDVREIERFQGLTQMLGGHAALASIFAPTDVLSHKMPEDDKLILCLECFVNPEIWLATLVEKRRGEIKKAREKAEQEREAE